MIDRISSGQTSTSFNLSNSVHRDTIKVKSAELVQQEKNEKDQYSKEKLEQVVDGMNQFVQAANTHLKFELHDKLNEYYVKIIDDKTEEVVKEIPSKRMLDIYAEMEKHLGILVDKKI